jgi:hypothetical protein
MKLTRRYKFHQNLSNYSLNISKSQFKPRQLAELNEISNTLCLEKSDQRRTFFFGTSRQLSQVKGVIAARQSQCIVLQTK